MSDSSRAIVFNQYCLRVATEQISHKSANVSISPQSAFSHSTEKSKLIKSWSPHKIPSKKTCTCPSGGALAIAEGEGYVKTSTNSTYSTKIRKYNLVKIYSYYGGKQTA